MDGSDGFTTLLQQAQQEYERVLEDNKALSASNEELRRRCRELETELGAIRAQHEAGERAATEAQAALRAQNASLLDKQQAAAEQVARLQLQVASLTRSENERVLRQASMGNGQQSGPATSQTWSSTAAPRHEVPTPQWGASRLSTSALSSPAQGHSVGAGTRVATSDQGTQASQAVRSPRAAAAATPTPPTAAASTATAAARSPHAGLLEEINRSIAGIAAQTRAVVEQHRDASMVADQDEAAVSGARGVASGAGGREEASSAGGHHHHHHHHHKQPQRAAEDIWGRQGDAMLTADRADRGSRGQRRQAAALASSSVPSSQEEESRSSSAGGTRRSPGEGGWLSARSPPGSGPKRRVRQKENPARDAATFFARLQSTLNREDLGQLLAILSEFNDAIITEEEAVNRAGVILRHYGGIQHEFRDFMRLSNSQR